MDFNIVDDILVMREYKGLDWKPVPVSHLMEALEWANKYKTNHSVEHSSRIGAKIIRSEGVHNR
jgi:hypothetical protein